MSFKQKIQYTNKSDYWNTPSDLYANIINEGWIDYNPADSMITPFNQNVSKYSGSKIYINPPFSLLSKQEMFETLVGLLVNNNKVLLLMPARTDTKYFHNFLKLAPRVYFIKGRLAFNDKGSAPFPTILLEFRFTQSNEYFTIGRNGDRKK